MLKINSWGNTISPKHLIKKLIDKNNAQSILQKDKDGIVFGLGRSYGDVCLNAGGELWKSENLNELISFDEKNGVLECESGMTIKSIQDFIIPKGWMLPVSPGTQFVTIGGAIANDIHGKNHHKYGTFSNHVLEILLLRSDSEPILCSLKKNVDWFKATVGGIGLTGIIYSCKIKLRKIDGPWLETESVAFKSIEEFFELSDTSEVAWEYTAAWIDCLHKKNIRGIFERANHISFQKNFKNRQYSFPFTPPFSIVNKFSLLLFNPMYFYLKSFFAKKRIVPYTKFLHPLDNILNWNRMYGPKGFYQFQCVLPAENGKEAIEEMLSIISSSKMGSFLVVIKTFSNFKPFGLLSFATPGVTFALDFPNQGNKTKLLFQKLQKIVERSKGKIYLAKDAMMDRDFFESSYPLLNKFKSFRDPHISSQMSKRLLGD